MATKKTVFRSGRKHPDSKLVREFEKRHWIMLPRSYKNLVKANDGGYPVVNALTVDDAYRGGRQTYVCVQFLGFLDGAIAHANDDGFYERLVHFAVDETGNLFSFDYRADLSERNPAVVLVCPDRPEGENILQLADGFDAFIAMLEKTP